MEKHDDSMTFESGQQGGSGRIAGGELMKYYKSVVGQIENAMPQRTSRVLMLSSSISGEGNTDVTVGLAMTVAGEMGRKTLVVDCNLHHPEVHLRFGLPDVGLGEFLTGRIPVEQAATQTAVPNLYAMPLGRGVASLSAIGEERLQKLIAELRSNFEYVLIDAAPVGVKRAKEIITRADGKVLGVILNRRTFPIPEFLYRKI